MSHDQAPANIDAEQALLGAVLVNDRVMNMIDALQPEHFYDPLHQRIFASMRALAAQGRRITPIMLKPEYSEVSVGNITGVQYLARLAAEATTVINAKDYASAIMDLASKRAIIAVAQELTAMASRVGEEAISPREIVEIGMGGLLSTYDASADGSLVSMSMVAGRLVRKIQDAWNAEINLGATCGLPFIDELIGSFMPGHLIVLGGESSMGKSALGLQIGYAMAKKGTPVLIDSLEMPDEEVATRVLAWETGISASRIEAASELTMEEMETLADAGRRIGAIPWIIDATGKLSVSQIAARARRAKQTHGIGMIVVDHLQFIRSDKRRVKDSKFDIIGEAIDDLKALAKELGVTVLALSQLTRGEGFPKFRSMSDVPRPHMKLLYGASEIEKAADRVILVHRPSWFLERMAPMSESSKEDLVDARVRWQGKAEIILAKRRGGKAPDRRFCRYVDHLMWFEPLKDDAHGAEGALF